MHAITVDRQGAPVAANVSFRSDFADPVAGPGCCLVRTEASALNHLDLWVGRGLPGLDTVYPHIGGSDGVGVVESVGQGVEASWVGRRVMLNAAVPQPEPPRPGVSPPPAAIRMIGEHDHGTHAARFVAPASNLLDIGDTDPVAAAAFGLTHLTAWRMMRTRASLRGGETVLITGIGGGVALAALAIARHLGCTAIVTSRSEAKLARAKELGADHGVLDRGEDWSREVRGLTGRRGVDCCIDSIGGAVFGSSVKSLARGGRYVTCGTTAGAVAPCELARVFWSQLSILGSTMGDMQEFREVGALLVAGAISPVIDSTFSPQDAANAYQRLESGAQFGKIVFDWRSA
ncbi:MAG: zinc-binding dehydrogenase [Phycisphaerales bacterium]